MYNLILQMPFDPPIDICKPLMDKLPELPKNTQENLRQIPYLTCL